jgi:uncharacterized protein YecE (DUF72 family)
MSGEVYTGTSGYSYDDWRDVFYPRSLAKSSFLEHYSGRFSCVEINFTYYRMPDARTIAGITERTPAGFLFTVKAFRGMTHEIDASSLGGMVRDFRVAVEPAASAGKLGCVLLQFPQSFHYTASNRIHLKRLLDLFEGLDLAVEFRGADWLKKSVYEGLRASKASLVSVDEPPLKGLMPPLDVVTSGIGYVRFHGRNAKTWYSGDSASRYDYLYSESELEEWVTRLKKISDNTTRTFAFMNNHWQGKAVENAIMLKRILARNGFRVR